MTSLTELEFSQLLWYDACYQPGTPFAVAAARATAGLARGALPEQAVVRQSRTYPTLKLVQLGVNEWLVSY